MTRKDHMTATLAALIDHHRVEVLSHLDRDSIVPVLDALQCQGDIIVIPTRPGKVAGLEPVPAAGVVLVRGESGGNTHLLLPSPGVAFAPAPAQDRGGLALGALVVDDGCEAFVAHPEHGYLGIAAGTYRVGRQRQMADVARVVAD
jgi:hypothetical protein